MIKNCFFYVFIYLFLHDALTSGAGAEGEGEGQISASKPLGVGLKGATLTIFTIFTIIF